MFHQIVVRYAKVIFLSSDANYSQEISNDPFFKNIEEYQKDGVAFWKKHGPHHPFLLANYPCSKNMGGVPFHRNFSKLKLTPEQGEHISFLELLDVPTIGNKSHNKKVFYELVSQSHLEYIDRLILGGGNKLFFVSKGVLKDMKKLKDEFPVFKWLDFKRDEKEKYLKTVSNGNVVQEIYTFRLLKYMAKYPVYHPEYRNGLGETANNALETGFHNHLEPRLNTPKKQKEYHTTESVVFVGFYLFRQAC